MLLTGLYYEMQTKNMNDNFSYFLKCSHSFILSHSMIQGITLKNPENFSLILYVFHRKNLLKASFAVYSWNLTHTVFSECRFARLKYCTTFVILSMSTI